MLLMLGLYAVASGAAQAASLLFGSTLAGSLALVAGMALMLGCCGSLDLLVLLHGAAVPMMGLLMVLGFAVKLPV